MEQKEIIPKSFDSVISSQGTEPDAENREEITCGGGQRGISSDNYPKMSVPVVKKECFVFSEHTKPTGPAGRDIAMVKLCVSGRILVFL